MAELQNYEKEVLLKQARLRKSHPFWYPKFEVSLKVESTVYHPISLNAAKLKAEKYLVIVPSDVPVISSSYIATLYQCDPPPKPTPSELSSFSSSMPGVEGHAKYVCAQALTLGVMRNVELGLKTETNPLADCVVAV